MLVSQGARTFAASSDVPTCDPAALVTPRCVSEWEHWKKMLDDPPPSIPRQDLGAEMPMQDTVGAISWDLNGRLAAGVSRFVIALTCSCTHLVHSGGLLLKYPGRIGEVRERYDYPGWSVDIQKAAVFGAGCWSQSDSRIGVSCSVSGLVCCLVPPRPRIDALQELGNRSYVLRLRGPCLNNCLNRTLHKLGSTQKMCLNESWVPTYDVSPTPTILSMLLMNPQVSAARVDHKLVS